MTRVHITAGALPVMVALALAALPERAVAACGGVQRAFPPKKERRFRPPLAIGDSVMLGAVPNLGRAGFTVNARGCRQMREGLGVIWSHRHAGTLPRVVVLALGANWKVRYGEIRRAMRLVGRRRLLVLVTPRESGGGQSADAWAMRRAARRFPKRVRLLDWVRHSAGRSAWFGADGLHLSPSGRRAFTRLLSRAHRFGPPAPPRRRPRPAPPPEEPGPSPEAPAPSPQDPVAA